MPTTPTNNWAQFIGTTTNASSAQPFPDWAAPSVAPSKPRVLSVCGANGHEKYTIAIGYRVAQCLVCNETARVDAIYTPGFKPTPRVIEGFPVDPQPMAPPEEDMDEEDEEFIDEEDEDNEQPGG